MTDPQFKQPHTPALSGVIRSEAADFQVDEIPSVTPCGEGEHLWLNIRKTDANTDWVAGQLARLFSIKRQDVGYAGLKDRNAVTTQWFSLYLPGREIEDVGSMLEEPLASCIEILQQSRHQRKLRPGTLEGNRFRIAVRDCSGDKAALEQTLQDIKQYGMPNYFGEQRFGQAFGNVQRASDWFAGQFKPKNRHQRSLYLSAARSWIFNHVLSARVVRQSWDRRLQGEVFMLDGSKAWFVDDGSEDLSQRLADFDIHPSGVLWGRGRLESGAEAAKLEQAVANEFADLCAGLEKHGLKQERRALRVKLADLDHRWLTDNMLQLEFSLPPGSYATVLLQQLVRY